MNRTHPLVVSRTVEKQVPWDLTEINFKGLDSGWHSSEASATDPLNGTDLIGIVHRFYVDLHSPTSQCSVVSAALLGHTTTVAVTSQKQWELQVLCQDENTVVACQSVQCCINNNNPTWTTVVRQANNDLSAFVATPLYIFQLNLAACICKECLFLFRRMPWNTRALNPN